MTTNKVQLIGLVDREKSITLKKLLIDEGKTYRQWLDEQMTAYIKQKRKKRIKRIKL